MDSENNQAVKELETNNLNNINNYDKETLDFIKRAEKEQVKITEKDIDDLLEKRSQEESIYIDFLKLIEEIDLSAEKFRVIITFGNIELVYDDGSFYLADVMDVTKIRKKLSKKQAKDMYVEYFIKFQFNPLIEQEKLLHLKDKVINLSKDIEIDKEKDNKEQIKPKSKVSKTKTKDTDIKDKKIKRSKEKSLDDDRVK